MPWWQELVYREGLLEEFAEHPSSEHADEAEDGDEEDDVRMVPLDHLGAKVVHVQFG